MSKQGPVKPKRRRGKRLGSYRLSLVAPVMPWVKVMIKHECSKRKFNNSRMKRVNLQHALREDRSPAGI